MKTILLVLTCFFTLSCSSQYRFPINRGVLLSNLDGGGKETTNLLSITLSKIWLNRPPAISNLFPAVSIFAGEGSELQISDSIWTRGALFADYGYYGTLEHATNANAATLFGSGIIPSVYLGPAGVLYPNGYGLTQQDTLPTNRVPAGVVGSTNWLFINYTGHPYCIATNRIDGGWQFIKMPAISSTP